MKHIRPNLPLLTAKDHHMKYVKCLSFFAVTNIDATHFIILMQQTILYLYQ